MKTLGLIGGMSWESTAIYYRHLNEIARERLGGLHSAKLLLWSFDFADVADLQQAGDWEGATALMIDAARRLEAGGAEALVICTNTMHRMASALETAVDLPLIHIADATAGRMKAAGAMRPALLATRFTMEQDFYIGRLRDRHRIDPLVPDEEGRAVIHRVIPFRKCDFASILSFRLTFVLMAGCWSPSRPRHNTTMGSRPDVGAWRGSANRAEGLR
jgi:aspartate racemase